MPDPVLTSFEQLGLYSVVGVAIAALIYAVLLARQILRIPKGSGKMLEVHEAIKQGANAYLRRQLKSVLYLVAILAVFLYLTAALVPPPAGITGAEWSVIAVGRALAFLMGAAFSALVGFLGMNMAVQGNIRVASASARSFTDALRIAYRSGTITGMLTDGLGLLGGTVIFLIFFKNAPEVLLGFGFGGTLLALFMRVGGGIYTKAADVGADLVGKVEKGIPEDDPRNAAVIADLVGDNVGDCAGMAADIFESYEVTIVSSMLLGLAILAAVPGADYRWLVFPLLVRGIGVVSSIIGTYAVSWWPTHGDAFKAMDLSYDLSSAISTTSFFFLAYYYVQDLRVFFATMAGILLAIGFNKFTNYFTSPSRPPVKQIAKSARTGPATVILSGLSSGMESTVWAILIIAATIFASFLIFGGDPLFVLYGVSLVGIGMLSHTGNNVAMDTFGPISDNANGIGEMAGMDPHSRQIMADLDAAGNTTKAITKGIAIASAVLAAVSLFGSYAETTNLTVTGLNIADPAIFVGVLIGGAIPFLFSSLAIKAVGRAASSIIEEVRQQFRVPGVSEGTTKPDYAKVVGISTSAAQRELISLALIAVLSPIVVGFFLNEGALGGFLAGIIVVGQLLAVFMANSGGAWDNAKKTIEDGLFGGKGSETHKASVIGDTVGDPLKDTSGPAINPMIKVINLVSLLVAPMILAFKGSLTSIAFATVAVAVVAIAVWYSKRETEAKVEAGATDAQVHGSSPAGA